MLPRHEMLDSDWIVIKKGTPPADKVGVAVGRAAPVEQSRAPTTKWRVAGRQLSALAHLFARVLARVLAHLFVRVLHLARLLLMQSG